MAIILEVVQGPSLSLTPTTITLESVGGVGPAGSDATVTATNMGAAIAGADALTTPLSTHGIAVEVSGVVKRTTWANIVATIQTAFSTVFQPLAAVLTNTTASFTTALESKLSGIETGADVTDATNIGSSIAGADALTTPTDTDALGVESSGIVKRTTWANIKATLKTYFDGLYAALGSGGIDYANPIAINGPGTITPSAGSYYVSIIKLMTLTSTSGTAKFSPGTATSRVIWGTGATAAATVTINPVNLSAGDMFEIYLDGGESRRMIWNGTDFIKKGGNELKLSCRMVDLITTTPKTITEDTDTRMPCAQTESDNSGQMADGTGDGQINLIRSSKYVIRGFNTWSAAAAAHNHQTFTRAYKDSAVLSSSGGFRNDKVGAGDTYLGAHELTTGSNIQLWVRHSDRDGSNTLNIYRYNTGVAPNWLEVSEEIVPW